MVWLFFWLGSLGPFLKLGAQKDTADVLMIGEYVVRLPYVLMFQFIPGMSRMFAPYRLSAMVVVATVALLALVLDDLRKDFRRVAGVVLCVLIIAQPFYRFDLGPIGDANALPSMWRIPTQISAMKLPKWYQNLDPDGWEGIIELPLEQQQDLICAYQSFHRRKVYRSWASTPAVPTYFRTSEGGDVGRRLRWLASEPPQNDKLEVSLRELSRKPQEVDFGQIEGEYFENIMDSGSYRWLVLHERGYYLLDPNKGDILYREVLRQFQDFFNMEAQQLIEQEAFSWPGKERNFPEGPAWIPWASQEVQRPVESMPDRYFMAVFDLQEWRNSLPSSLDK